MLKVPSARCICELQTQKLPPCHQQRNKTLGMIMHFYFAKQKETREFSHAFRTRCSAVCVCPHLFACFPASCCITGVCLHAPSEDPAVCACVFAIHIACLPLFARMNTNLAQFLMGKDAGFCFFFATPPCFPQSPKTGAA